MTFDIRPITDDEITLFRTKLVRGFGSDIKKDDEDATTRFKAVIPLERTRAAFDGSEMIGTLGCVPYELTVPGGGVRMGGTTMVTVQATHRRRGALREMMLSHLEDVRSAEEPVAGLWASESSIYGRFGFGPATARHEVEIDATTVRFARDDLAGTLRQIEQDEAAGVLPPIHEKLRASRPGALSRDEDYWKWEILYDPEHWREGASERRYVVYSGPDGDEGYVMYRQKEKWEGFFSQGKVSVNELVATTPAAHDGLWRYLTNIDLFPRVACWNQPIDDELPWRIDDPRRVVRKVWDALWLRVLDIPAALSARSYAIDGVIRIGVTDDLYPGNDGIYEVTSEAGRSSCRKITGEADLRMNVDALGAIYLGGQKLGTMLRADRVEGSPEAIRLADSFFAWDPAPWCPEVF